MPGAMRVVDIDTLPKDGLVVEVGFMGAPTVGLEKLDSDQAVGAALAAVAAYRAVSSASTPTKAELVGLIAGEIGGGNGLEPLVAGASMDLPVVDGDFMGRALPELQVSVAVFCFAFPPFNSYGHTS